MSEADALGRYQRALEAIERQSPVGLRGEGRALLSFEPGLEHRYLEHRRLETRPITRLGLLLAALLYLAFFLVDALLFQRYQFAWTLIPILGIAGGGNLLLLASTYAPRFDPRQGWMGAVMVLVNAFAFAFASAWGYREGHPIPPEPAVIQQLYTLFLLNLPFRLCLPVTVVIVGAFTGLHAAAGLPPDDLFIRCFMMLASGTLGTFACYLVERTQRLAWLRAQLLQELSEHDPLTGVHNRRVFYERGETLIGQARRDGLGVAVLLGDIDHFKRFNDSHGHLAGDEALRCVAKALSTCKRHPADLLARLGGEEFGFLLHGVTAETARRRAEEICSLVRGLALPDGLRVTISVGLAHAGTGSRIASMQTLTGAADAALYRAKHDGRDRVGD